MTDPIEVSKTNCGGMPADRWNAFLQLLTSATPDEFTPIQRVAYLAWWYSSEILNGGHDQYFGNNAVLDQAEVVKALKSLGAMRQSEVLGRAHAVNSRMAEEMPNDHSELIVWEKENKYTEKMADFDQEFYACEPPIEAELLESFLIHHESEFIRWVP